MTTHHIIKTIGSRFGQYFMILVMVLSVSACLPEEESILSENEDGQIEAQVKHYAQAFQQYSSRALNAVVNSSAWAAQSIPEGVLNMDTAMFGNTKTGSAEGYMSNALCKDGSDYYHISWFESADDDGNLSLKGLGTGQSGQAALAVKSLIPEDNFGHADGSNITMSDGTDLNLTGGCSSLSIPNGSAVAVYKMPEPQQIASTEIKTILRGTSCPANQEGIVTQSISATFSDDGSIYVNGSQYSSEQDVIDNHSTGWATLNSDCYFKVVELERIVNPDVFDAFGAASLGGKASALDGTAIGDALSTSLKNVDCTEATSSNPSDDDVEFTTCSDSQDLELMDLTGVDEKTLLREEEEILVNSCPQTYGGGTVTINTAAANYSGISPILNQKQANLTRSELTGDIRIKKITRFWNIATDYGDGIENREISTIETVGQSIACYGSDSLKFSCGDVYDRHLQGESYVTLKTDNGPLYKRNIKLQGWADPKLLVPNQYTQSQWNLASMRCKYEQLSPTSCTTSPLLRRFDSSAVTNNIDWGDWEETSLDPMCRQCDYKISLQYVLDSSGSVGRSGWDKTLEFVRRSYATFTNVEEATIIDFDSNAAVRKHNKRQVETWIANGGWIGDASGGTHGYKGLNLALNKIREWKASDDVDSDTYHVVIYVSDGRSAGSPQSVANQIRSIKNTIVFGVGVGNVSQGQMVAVSGGSANYFKIGNYTELERKSNELAESICDEVGKLPEAQSFDIIKNEITGEDISNNITVNYKEALIDNAPNAVIGAGLTKYFENEANADLAERVLEIEETSSCLATSEGQKFMEMVDEYYEQYPYFQNHSDDDFPQVMHSSSKTYNLDYRKNADVYDVGTDYHKYKMNIDLRYKVKSYVINNLINNISHRISSEVRWLNTRMADFMIEYPDYVIDEDLLYSFFDMTEAKQKNCHFSIDFDGEYYMSVDTARKK